MGKDKKYLAELLAKRVNFYLHKIVSMDDEKREEYVNNVIDWICKMFNDIAEAANSGNKIRAIQIANRYREEISDLDKKASVIACLTYCINDKYRKKLMPLFIGALGLV